MARHYIPSANVITVYSFSDTPAAADGILTDTPIEIRVYN